VGIVWLAARTFWGEIDASQFAVMVILLTAMLDPVRKIANVYNMVQRSSAAAQRIFEFLDRPDEHSARQAVDFAPAQAPGVRFERVTYRYNPDAPAAVEEATLDVRPGECIALVGPNGSGKSTLLKCLPRLLVPESGRIWLDVQDVAQVRLKSLREQIAFVAQRPAIFARTVRENIAYGNGAATPEDVRIAAKQAFAAEFIEQLPQGYETVLGEFGTSLSGGQRQRLAIARAFLKRCSVLIFDEATSEIDAESESKIHAALNELRRGKTTFLIAHRHTVMDMADRIVVMDAGRIVDVGTHAELTQRCALYVALYRSPAAH
jgi:ABC-type multidrug transport system fused ATPase/permease subunit